MSAVPEQATTTLAARLTEFGTAVEEYIRARLADAALPAELHGMLGYHLGWLDERFQPVTASGGKRVRPALCLLVCEAAGGRWQSALPAAAAVEMVHNFSLIHDDIEDGSSLRRHRPTLWSLWGEARAINAGDALLVEAELALLAGDLPADRRLAAAELLGRACRALCAGQQDDLSPAKGAPSVAAYYAMIRGKTAALLQVAAELGALAAGADAPARHAYGRFGQELGLAFQVQDDWLDVWGAPALRGKAAREDVRTAKRAYPLALAYDRANASRRAELDRLLAAPPLTDHAVVATVAIFEALGVREAAAEQVRVHTERARAALAEAHPTPDGAAQLAALAESLLGRES